MAIAEYQKKRNFSKTPEPAGHISRAEGHRFVVQEHHASRLHFDLRLEMDGVLKSWAVPKGPSLDPADKRLAVQTEDHPLEYLTFEGHIPEGNYGAGDMVVWDTGRYETRGSTPPDRQLAKGHLKLRFFGDKLHGDFALVRMPDDDSKPQWLLIKDHDEFAEPGWTLKTLLPDTKKTKKSGTPAMAGAKTAPMPEIVKPMLATLVDEPFTDDDWLFEVKWDGYRAVCFIENGKARLISRNDQDLSARFPYLSQAPALVDAKNAVLDGELVALDDEGVSRFQLLQPTWRGRATDTEKVDPRRLAYYVFDLLYYNGQSLMDCRLVDRKELLRTILRPTPFLRFSDHITGQGEALYAEGRKKGLEGVIAKRLDSRYEERRSREWLKVKQVQTTDVVIGGYTEPRGSRKDIGALVVGLYRGEDLIGVGHVGAGSRAQTTRAIYERLKPLATDLSPFAQSPKTNEPAQWVRPELVCEVKFSEWTNDFQLRQPVLLGLREDKDPKACVFEKPKSAELVVAEEDKKAKPAGKRSANRTSDALDALLDPASKVESAQVKVGGNDVELSNLNKVLWPKDGITKRDLLRYYHQMAETILPHLADRPLILQRYPHGIDKPSFYQHNVDDAPKYVEIFEVEESSGTVCYAVCDNEATLLYIVHLAAIAFNPWHSRTDKIDNPDWIVFDLDPHGAPYRSVLDVALTTRDVLGAFDLECYPKTSGSSGLHIYVPIARRYSYQQGLAFANVVGAEVERRVPDLITRERTVRDRPKGKIYFDCYQNSKGKTIAAPYSVRACAGATVSMPLTWEQVEKGVRIEDFTIANVPDLAKRDLFAPVLNTHQPLPFDKKGK